MTSIVYMRAVVAWCGVWRASWRVFESKAPKHLRAAVPAEVLNYFSTPVCSFDGFFAEVGVLGGLFVVARVRSFCAGVYRRYLALTSASEF